jgi:hypothetical protein
VRSSEQIGRTVEEYRDFKQAERQRTLRELLARLWAARANRVEWYTWATEGQPILSPQAYAQVGTRRARKPKSA